MAWRGLHISQPAKLKLHQGHIHIETQGEGDKIIALPLEDIAWIIFDTQQIHLSAALLAATAEAGIALICTDARHMPAGMLLSFHRHHAQASIAFLQKEMSAPLCKRLWQYLVQSKIINQGKVLSLIGDDYSAALYAMAERVKSGDTDNVEAQAARAYWQHYMQGFRRHADDHINALLNYGYAIVRAAIARACVAHGLIPAFGIHHKSQTNAFNLVDDLIEPFRPFVDWLAYQRATTSPADRLTLEDRQYMAGILLENLIFDKQEVTLFTATEFIAANFVRAIENQSAALLNLPTFLSGPYEN